MVSENLTVGFSLTRTFIRLRPKMWNSKHVVAVSGQDYYMNFCFGGSFERLNTFINRLLYQYCLSWILSILPI